MMEEFNKKKQEKIKYMNSSSARHLKFDIEIFYEMWPEKTKTILNLLKKRSRKKFKFLESLKVSVFGWDDEKLNFLISKNVIYLVECGCDFSRIEKCYDENKNNALFEIYTLLNLDLLSKTENFTILNWPQTKIQFMFCSSTKKIIESGANPIQLLYCFEKNLDKTKELLFFLMEKNLFSILKNIKVEMLDWSGEKKQFIFSEITDQLIENEVKLENIEFCFDNYLYWTKTMISLLKNYNCLKLGKYVFGESQIFIISRWSEQKIKDLFSKNVLNLIEQGANFFELVQMYDHNPNQVCKLLIKKNKICQLCELNQLKKI